jgi:small-conductance mechanosensitive channel
MQTNKQRILSLLYLFLVSLSTAYAQNTQKAWQPVVFNQDTVLFVKNSIGAFSPKQRAENIENNLQQLQKLPLREFDSLYVNTTSFGSDVVYQDRTIISVTPLDAQIEGKTAVLYAEELKDRIQQALIKDYKDHSWGNLGKDIGLFALALLVLLLAINGINKLFDFLRKNLKKLQHNVFFRENSLVKLFKLITPETERKMLLFLLRMFRFTMLGLFLYLYLPFMFSQISYTRGFGETLMGYILSPLQFLGNSILSYFPKFLFVIIIVIAVRYLMGGLTYFAQQVKAQKIAINGFYPDWAVPTLNLVKALIIIFTLIIIFPYLPGAGSDAFQGVSVFVGLLLSLGSAGAISNMISGVILTYMRPFQAGDYVKINDTTGTIVGKNLLVTRVKTTKNEEITLPNSTLLSGGIVNYTALADKNGLILHTMVTIGYDVPWKTVHQLLISAAQKTTYIEGTPEPFILQKSLDDWYVSYELNAYTKESHQMARIYSELHLNIQDAFNEANVEIMSPHYLTLRDGNLTTIPSNYLPKDYKTPTFNVNARDKKEE